MDLPGHNDHGPYLCSYIPIPQNACNQISTVSWFFGVLVAVLYQIGHARRAIVFVQRKKKQDGPRASHLQQKIRKRKIDKVLDELTFDEAMRWIDGGRAFARRRKLNAKGKPGSCNPLAYGMTVEIKQKAQCNFVVENLMELLSQEYN